MSTGKFRLDERLQNDCIVIGEMNSSWLLLMNNSKVPWFILVPKVEGVIELYELELSFQLSLMNDINQLSRVIKQNFNVDKLNVAAIGNIVRQMHIHVVARTEDDYCWPGVVWGAEGKQLYTDEEIKNIVKIIEAGLDEALIE